jgi:hypothetical protein
VEFEIALRWRYRKIQTQGAIHKIPKRRVFSPHTQKTKVSGARVVSATA